MDASQKHSISPPVCDADLHQVVQNWLTYLADERGHAALSNEAYLRDLSQFLIFLAHKLGRPVTLRDLSDMDAKTIRAFMASRRGKGIVSRSLARQMSALRMFFRWA